MLTLVLTKLTMGSISATTNAPALMKGRRPDGDISSALDLLKDNEKRYETEIQ